MISRIKHILEQKNLPPSRFADKIGVPRSTISHILSGRNKPSLEVTQKILNAFPDIPIEWLLQGKGRYYSQSYSLFDSDDTVDENSYQARDEGSDVVSKPEENANASNIEPDRLRVSIEQQDKKSSKKIENPAGTVEKVIILYRDGTFREYKPSV